MKRIWKNERGNDECGRCDGHKDAGKVKKPRVEDIMGEDCGDVWIQIYDRQSEEGLRDRDRVSGSMT